MWDATWERFVAGPVTLGPTPGAREAWHRGRSRFAVWLLRIEEPAVDARIDEARRCLLGHGARAFTEPHLTVFVAGFPCEVPVHDDDVSEAALLAQAAALESSPPPAPRLSVGGVNAFLTCPVLEVHDPHGDLSALRARLDLGAREIRFAPYLPHVTAGLFTDTRDTAPITAALTPLRGLAPFPIAPRRLDLVSFDTRVPTPRLLSRWGITLPRAKASG